MDTRGKRLYCIMVMTMCMGWCSAALAQETPLSFGVMPQRPRSSRHNTGILFSTMSVPRAVYPSNSNRTRLPPEHEAMIQHGAFDFAYSNYLFFPWNTLPAIR